MTQLLLSLLAASLVSCSVINRTFHKNKIAIDSTAISANSSTGIRKKDSIGSQKIASSKMLNVDSGYSRTTLVREYLTSTSSRPDDYFIPDSVVSKNNKLLYREILISEQGDLQRIDQQNSTTESSNSVKKTDSAGRSQHQTLQVQKSTVTTDREVSKRKWFPGWIWWLLILPVGLGIYCYYKKYTPLQLWQTLLSHIK